MKVLLLILQLFVFVFCQAQEKVAFLANDSLKITADLYLINYKFPFVLLFHQSDASRGEYKDIAEKLGKLNFNCLAVDLRSGGKINYIENETAQRAVAKGLHPNLAEAIKDIEASIEYVQKFSLSPVILFGSSFSASLCLVEANKNDHVKAIVAFSPGEYFRPGLVIHDKINGLEKPVFAASTSLEAEYVNQLLSGIDAQYKTIYYPQTGKGMHGAKALWNNNSDADACWLALMLFLKNLR